MVGGNQMITMTMGGKKRKREGRGGMEGDGWTLVSNCPRLLLPLLHHPPPPLLLVVVLLLARRRPPPLLAPRLPLLPRRRLHRHHNFSL